MTGPILFAGRLPRGALLRADATAAPPAPPARDAAPAPLWLDKDHGMTGPRALSWQARHPQGLTAEAVADNAAGTARAPSGALAFAARQNTGLLLARAIPDAAHCALAAILHPEPRQPGGTVLSLRPLDGSGYLFLSVEDGTARIGRKDGDLSLSLPVPEGAILLHLALSDGRIALSVNGGPPQRLSAALQGGADLYIGCRDGRGGLKNKLGAFRLSDLMVWPDGPAPDLAAAPALWRERRTHGI